MIFKTKKYPAIKQSYCVVASYRLAAHASMIVGHDNLPVLNCKTKHTNLVLDDYGSLSNTLKYKGRQKHDDVFIYLFSYTQIEVEVDNRMEY